MSNDVDSQMKQDTEAELSSILQKYDDELTANARAAEQKKIEEQKLSSDLERIRVKEIIPAMEEIGLALRKRGHDYEIIEKAMLTKDTMFPRAIIGMTVFPKGLKRANVGKDYGPHVLVSFQQDAGEIEFGYEAEQKYRRGLKESGHCGRFKIDQVTRELVEQQIVSALKRGLFA